jgi:hypothetical protein
VLAVLTVLIQVITLPYDFNIEITPGIDIDRPIITALTLSQGVISTSADSALPKELMEFISIETLPNIPAREPKASDILTT